MPRSILLNPAHQSSGGTVASQGNDPDVIQPQTNPEPAELRNAAVGHPGRNPEKESIGSNREYRRMAERGRAAEGCLAGTIGWWIPETGGNGEKTPRGEEREGLLHLCEDDQLKGQEAVKHTDRPGSGESVASPGMSR
ncbi:hypothetical protein NDU88_003949 [Pleurodeles waltl]|uniref:Uncharacterized protein n=1 Tax=Pleurodeles waltl TaxID=8319 RepID=A0AAV7W3L3_PLEWA|nr:hypothetical protein NDU88_003949 [Pleurodeles waltl]